MRMLLVVGLLAVVVLVPGPAGGVAPARDTGRDTGRETGRDAARDTGRALAVLHRWDARREAAWARADPAALRRLYVPGSTAAEADVRLLRRWSARGLLVRRLRTQVFSAAVRSRSPASLRLRLLDRVAGGEVSDGRRVVRLPAGPPVLRVVELRRDGGRWRVAAVRRVNGGDRAPRPGPSARRDR